MAQSFRYFHSPQFSLYNFGAGHAFHPIRQDLTYDLAVSAQLINDDEIVHPQAADDSVIGLFHASQYIRAVKEAGSNPSPFARPEYGLGTGDNPLFPQMHEATAIRVGATLEAAQAVINGQIEHAANFGGGLHHAGVAKASGFCIYNDAAVAIAWLRRYLDCKIAYIDLDAHHGDGVQWGFYADPDVLTISIHESGQYLFPGTGGIEEIGEGHARGTSVNIPLLPDTTSDSWFDCLYRVVPDIIDAFRPDIIITQHGCDSHRLDPLTHLSVSVEAMDRATRLIHQLAHEYCQGRWVALGGGGYAIWQVVPRAWALVWATMTDREINGRVPSEWLSRWTQQSPVPLPECWYDVLDETPTKDSADFEGLWRATENEKSAESARKTALSYLKQRRRSL